MTQPQPSSTDRPALPQLSIVVPLYNEDGTVEELHRRLSSVLSDLGRTYEIVFVDDGSRDRTYFVASAIGATDPHLRIVKLARNYGQTAALAAGFDYARGDVIVSMDGDLQHAPEDLPKLLDKLAEGYDIASGWRARRVDNYLTRRLPSKIANWMMAKLSGVELHDFGTTFKAYRAPVIKRISLYGDLHRFIPALASWQGARIAEVPISNVEGKERPSHYGLSRTWRVLADLLTVRFLLRYLTRPMHFFGPIGFGALAAGTLGGIYLVAHKLIFGESIFLLHGPLLLLSVLLLQSGVVLIGLGLLAEILTRIYLDGHYRRIYTVEQIVPEPAPARRPRRHRPVARSH